MHTFYKLIIFTASVLFVCMPQGLAVEPPTENQGANTMDAKISRESNGLLRLVSFRKTNGQMANFGGIETYTMDCVLEVVAIQDCAMTGFMMGTWTGGFGAVKAKKNASELEKFDPSGGAYLGYKQVPKGARMSFTTKIRFDLTERGWRTENLLPSNTPFVPDLPTNPPEPNPSAAPEVTEPQTPTSGPLVKVVAIGRRI